MSDGLELRWPGKYDDQGRRSAIPRPGARLQVQAIYPATTDTEDSRVDEASESPSPNDQARNRLIEGDNLLALDALVREHAGAVDLVYIDPPFATGGRFSVVSPVGARPPRGDKGLQLRQPAYTDSWPGGVGGLLAMLDPRLRLVHQLLAPNGSLYVHIDPTVGHAVKLLLDEVFGPECFQRQIVWRIGWVSGFKTRARNWIRNHDLLLFYVKDPARFTFNKHYVPHPPGYRRRDGALPKGQGVPLCDVWNAGDAELALRGHDSLDSIQIKSFSTEKTGYATQKNESLLERVVRASSNPGDLVADVFCGSGTTLAVAEQLGRRWIGCDVGRAAIQISTARLLGLPRAHPFEACTVAEPSAASEDKFSGPTDESLGPKVRQRAEDAWTALAGDDAPALTLAPSESAEPKTPASVVAAWRWSVPVPHRVEGDTLEIGQVWPPRGRGRAAALRAPPQLVLQRSLWSERAVPRPELALAERARLWIALDGVDSASLSVRLRGLVYPHPELLPEALRTLEPPSLSLVEWWSVAWGASAEPVVDAVFGRFDRTRTLTTISPAHRVLGRRVELLVRVHDVLHREHRLRCVLTRTGERRAKRWTVERAFAECG